MSIIGISGFASAGKDTVGDYLVDQHGWDGKIAFASNLKEMVKKAFILTEEQVSTQHGKGALFSKPITLNVTNIGAVLTWMCKTHDKLNISSRIPEIKGFISSLYGKELFTPREVLQFIGTDFCRYICDTYHLDIVEKFISGSTGNWVITDVRFLNEAEFIKGLGGKVLRVRRPCLEVNQVRHESETALQSWDGWSTVINNDTDISNLYNQVDLFLKENSLCRKTTL